MISKADIDFFHTVCGKEFVFTQDDMLQKHAHDETEDFHFLPHVVIKPANTAQVSSLLNYCNRHKIPVTTQGARTGLSGGALCVQGGVALSMEKFNRILQIDEKNLQVTVEPGVITQVLQEAVIEKGLYYPPDPSSRGSCFIGGNVAENAGGPRAVKYGVTKDYVLNLEVVLPDGEIIWTGANVLKNATGYNLTQLMVGSEGTLGVITKIVLRLIPYPPQHILMLIPFHSAVKACEAVSAVFRAGITPSAMEFMERDALEWTMKYVDNISIEVKETHQAHLLVEIDGFDLESLYPVAERVVHVAEQFDCDEVLFADTADQKEQLWKMRRRVGEAVKSNSVYKEEDTVVPRYELPVLLAGVKEIGSRYGFKSVCYGHAGDGNLHVNIIRGDLTEQQWNDELPNGIREIFHLVKKLGGTLSGEHGIGWVQKDYMEIFFNAREMSLQKDIKQLFDPNGILNPGKVFPT